MAGLKRKQGGVWRRRCQEYWDSLTLLECSEPSRLREAVRGVLRDALQSGSSGKFTAEPVCQILAVACEMPSLSNRPITHWTQKELTAEVIKRGIVDKIASVQVGRYLPEAARQPHRHKMSIKTTEQDPEIFQEQVQAVCETYLQATSRAKESGSRTISVDEMTGVQVLERCAPDPEMQPEQVARQLTSWY